MSIEIKTNSVEPIRNTYSNIKRRFGDKPATRYQEASFDIEAVTNFHYKPLWDPQHKLNDPSRSVIRMADWHSVTDPRSSITAPMCRTARRCRKPLSTATASVTSVA